MKTQKISSELAKHLENPDQGENSIDVVVELTRESVQKGGDYSRQQKITALKESFSQKKSAVERVVEEAGGQILEQAWLNQTLQIRVPAHSINSLCEIEDVILLDIPHSLMAD